MRTSSPANRNALGRRTACERPFQNSLAVSLSGASGSTAIFFTFYIASPCLWYIPVYTIPSSGRKPTTPQATYHGSPTQANFCPSFNLDVQVSA